jgi:acyl-CoA synthetase (NDP forming)
MRDLTKLIAPRSVAIVGASDDPRKVRGMAVGSLIQAGFTGAIHPVNPSHATVQGLTAYPDLASIPGDIDLAVVVVAAEHVVAALEQAAARGVGAAIVLAGLPSGGVGEAMHHAIAEVACRTGLTVLGPNALGLWNPLAGVAATFAPLVERPGDPAPVGERTIGIVSHSGGIGLSIYDKCHRAGLGVRYAISTGNEADLDMVEVMDWLIEEGGTRIILAYLEGFAHSERFAPVAAKAADRGVAIVILKAGTSSAGARAAVSHTAHLTGADTAYDAIFERYGVLRAPDIEALSAMARILSGGRAMTGDRAMILSTGGGFGALIADACEARGVRVPDLDDDMKARLGAVIPAYGHSGNPVDLPGGYVLEDNGVSLARIIDDFGASDTLDAVILCFNLDAPGRIARMHDAIAPALSRLTKPALFHSPTQVAPDNARLLAALGVHQFSVAECAAGLAALRRHTDFAARWKALPTPTAPSAVAAPHRDRRWTHAQAVATLAAFGIGMPPQDIATDVDDAVAQAARIGYPVALKIHSGAIAHKSDVGGVALNIVNEPGLRAAYGTMLDTVARRAPGVRIDGMLVQRMAAPGREFAIGVVRDPDFGPLLMLSVGGIWIEVLKDAVFAPLPLWPGDARRMIDGLQGRALLGALRGAPPADAEALERLLYAVSDLIEQLGDEIDEIELNPVIVHPQGAGVSVVDLLLTHPEPARQTAAA